MRRLFYTFVCTLLTVCSAQAQLQFSDSVRISLLTCSEGPEAYERFGHTALRIEDLKTQNDLIFHYGVFSFDAPNFIYRFVKGETDYRLGATYTRYFLDDYQERGLRVTQLTLDLTPRQGQQVVRALQENYLPENRTYRYSFFFDNCATRPFHLLNTATHHAIQYDTTWIRPVTLRDMLKQKTYSNNWLDFGISLVIAGRADRQASFAEQMFLPGYLEQAYLHASVREGGDTSLTDTLAGSRPLVSESRELLPFDPQVKHQIESSRWITSPLFVCTLLFIIACLLSWLDCRTRRSSRMRPVSRIFDTIWLAATGLGGIITWFLNFFSTHPAVDSNWNCLWLLPTHLLFAILIWIKLPQKWVRIYFFITFAAIIVYLIGCAFVEQRSNPAFLLITASMMLRCWANIRQ